TVLDDLHREIGAHRTFKGALIVIRLFRLYAGQPHLRSAKFTKWLANDPLLRKNLSPSHATPPRAVGAHTQTRHLQRKKRVSPRGGTAADPFPLLTALRQPTLCARTLYSERDRPKYVP